MFDRPRNWKWMVPASLVVPCLVWWEKAWGAWEWGEWSMVPASLAAILFIAAVVNLVTRVADDWANIRADLRTVENSTPEVRMFEAAKGMHPDAVKALLLHRRTIWRVKYIPLKDVTDWIMDEAPSVHAGFVDFVLDHSNGTIMSKRLLSEGSKSFDPEGIVADYQQYDDLLRLMQSKLMCTSAYGNQGPQLLPPWSVDLIRHRFGLDGDGYGVDEEMSDALQQVVSEQKKAWGTGADAQKFRSAEVPDVISQALDGLEQTAEMRAKFRSSKVEKEKVS